MRAAILSTYGYDSFVSSAIRWITQIGQEGRSWSNHNADWFELKRGEHEIFPDGTRLEGPCEFVIESTFKGTRLLKDWRKQYDTKKQWALAIEPKGTTEADALKVFAHAKSYLGYAYDIWSIARQAADGLFGKLLHREIHIFRHIRIGGERKNRYNICTWLMAWSWWQGRRWQFYRRKYETRTERCGPRLRMKRVQVGWEPVGRHLLNPDDVFDNVFDCSREGYVVIREVGRRPKKLDSTIASKIDADLGARHIAAQLEDTTEITTPVSSAPPVN
jgi:hypothetical protein